MKHYYLNLLLLFLPFSLFAKTNYNSIEFIENRGQWKGDFLYKAVTGGGDVYLEKNCFTYLVGAADNAEKVASYKHAKASIPPVLKYHAFKMIFDGASVPAKIEGNKAQRHYYNYFLGNDPKTWASEIHPFYNVDYAGLYKNIDLHVASENLQLKYDFIIHPEADASQIKLRFEGIDGLNIKNGKLQIKTSVGTIEELQPYAYQFADGKKISVPCEYVLEGSVVHYRFPKAYDNQQQLIIDPTVVFATFTGSTSDNWGFTATYDEQGNFYAGGAVSGVTYPTTTGAFQTTFAGGGTGGGNNGFQCDMAITKFNAAGTAIIYSTYLGGSNNDQPHSMIVDPNNNLIVAGRTYSNDFPVSATAFDNSYNGGADLVVIKLNATGTGLIGSTYIGGSGDDAVNISSIWGTVGSLKHNYGDDARSEVITDKLGNAYVALPTSSTNFPVLNAVQTVNNGQQDGAIIKLNNTLSALLWGTYIGGSGNDATYALALDTGQTSLYVAGGTASNNFPSTPGCLMPAYQGGTADGFVLKFLNSGTYPLQAGTFIGRNNYDQCYGVQVDRSNKVYAMGNTLGGLFPVTAGVYSNPGSSQFIIKLDPNLTTNVYSTVFGNGNSASVNLSPVAFLVDTCENVYISGWGGNLLLSGGAMNNMPITPGTAFQTTTNGNGFYFFVISKNAQALLYGSYLAAPANNEEHVDGGTSRFDKNGIIYQGICGGCGGQSNFPTTPGSWSTTNGSSNCNFLAVKIAFNFILSAKATIFPDTIGCAPLTVQFNNGSVYAVSYDWDFGDGQHDTATVPVPHTYTTPGTYHIRLIAINANACNKVRDTSYATVIVIGASIKSDFNYSVTDSCTTFSVAFTNASTYSSTPGSPGFTTFKWNFGDGTNFTGANPGTHNFPAPGTYIVTLTMRDSTACNNPDSIKKIITIANNFVRAGFKAPDSICLNSAINFIDTSKNATSLLWSFGDGKTSTSSSPSHLYAQPGTYTVTLIASNPNSCNKIDSIKKTVKIKTLPIANFDFSPHIPVTNSAITFTNLSQFATTYFWNFGDNTSSIEVNPVHMYKRTGKFNVCLVAKSSDGCLDTVCKTVETDIRTLVDVPTGFSPNGDGNNDILYVRGGAIEKIQFKIFNRWGQKIFESNDLNVGWDGTYNGKPQEIDAYAFTLNVTFIDGTTAFKKGNVTLLR